MKAKTVVSSMAFILGTLIISHLSGIREIDNPWPIAIIWIMLLVIAANMSDV